MRILYGVSGEGMGHAVRSKAIIQELQKEHKVKVIAGGKAYKFLKPIFSTTKIGYLNIVYRKNKVSYTLTLLTNIIKLPFIIVYNFKMLQLFIKFKPNLIITDFEPFSSYSAAILNKPCISIDNQHIVNTDLNKNLFFEKFLVRFCIPKANYYLITTFFYPKIKNKKTFLFPPINRNEIITAKQKQENHILVYQTSKSNKKLIPILNSINEKFILYGFNQNKTSNNVILKNKDEKEFLKDLISCKAVITNGGFTLIGESLHLKKPILSIPVEKQFEQKQNAIQLQKLGYGKYEKKTTKSAIQNFITNLDKYKSNLNNYKSQDNSKLFKKLKEIINSLKS